MTTSIQIKIVNQSKHPLPHYATQGAAGMDLHANIEQPIQILPQQRAQISTGLYLAIPPNFEAQVRSRSGLAWKHGIIVLNSPGTIDQDYRGELKILLYNSSSQSFSIQDGDRIAQLVIAKYEHITWQPVKTLDATQRGIGGFGSTEK